MISAKELFGQANITKDQQDILLALRKTLDNIYVHKDHPKYKGHFINKNKQQIRDLLVLEFRKSVGEA